MPLPIGSLITCRLCGHVEIHHGKGLCKSCHNKVNRGKKYAYFKIYIAEYRQHIEYKEQRKEYDVKYQLKED